jgi:hypothetical protein
LCDDRFAATVSRCGTAAKLDGLVTRIRRLFELQQALRALQKNPFGNVMPGQDFERSESVAAG